MTSTRHWLSHVRSIRHGSGYLLTRVAADLEGQFDRFLCDPPFLNDDCHTKGECIRERLDVS
jgi:Probable N6-adenine methyltransferase